MNKIINLQKEWKEEDVLIDELYLDEDNIRLDINEKDQKALITDLFSNEQAMKVFESIYKNGLFPDEVPVIIKEAGKNIVVDGNRRVASLKVMLRPEIAPQKYRTKIEKLMKGYSPIEKIKIIVAPDRKAVDNYLAAKHTKTTRLSWTALRRSYFYYAQKQNGISVEDLIIRYSNKDIPSYIKMYEMHQIALSLDNISEDVRRVVDKKNFKISTLERLYNDKYVQEKLGISFNSKTGEVSAVKNKEFDIAYSKIITDIVEKKISSRKEIKDEKDRKKYIDGFIAKKISSKVKVGVSKFTPKSTKKIIEFLIPDTIVSTLNSPGIDRRIAELKKIDYKRFPNITTDALRSLLEVVLKKYFDRINNPMPKKSAKKYNYLLDALSHAKRHFDGIGNQEIKQVINLIGEDKDFFDMINHNPSAFSNPQKTKDLWDTMQELFIFIFDDVEKINKKKIKK